MEEKSCSNCKHFFQHYIKRMTDYHAISCGHCRKDSRKTNPDGCKDWENKKELAIQRRQLILDVLRNMSAHLEEIAHILKSDEEEQEEKQKQKY